MNHIEDAAIYSGTYEMPARARRVILPQSDKAAGSRKMAKVGKPGVCVECLSRVCEHVIPARTRILSPRQSRILTLLSRGLCNKEIAQACELTEGTVKVYLHHIFKILGFSSRLEAALWARDHVPLLDTPAEPISA